MRMGMVETGSSVSSCGCPNAPRILLRLSLVGKRLDKNLFFGPVVFGLFSEGDDGPSRCLPMGHFQ